MLYWYWFLEFETELITGTEDIYFASREIRITLFQNYKLTIHASSQWLIWSVGVHRQTLNLLVNVWQKCGLVNCRCTVSDPDFNRIPHNDAKIISFLFDNSQVLRVETLIYYNLNRFVIQFPHIGSAINIIGMLWLKLNLL